MSYTKTNWVNGTTPVNDTNMNKIENALENLDTNISKSTDEYSSTRTYSIGELVIYNNKLYKANQDITTAEAFNSSHWTEVTLLSDVNEIKSVVNNNADNLNNLNDVIDAKANTSDVYTKTELDTKINALDSNKINFSYLTDFTNGIARKKRVSNVDFNSLATFQSGLITILNATANAPVNKKPSHWYVLQIYTKEGEYEYMTQIATYFFDYDDTNIYIRKCLKGTWGAWRKIATSAV